MGKSLFQKVWDSHRLGTLADGRAQLFIGTHLIHEVTSPQAFGMLRDLGLKVKFPQRTFATVDHIVPTVNQDAPQDPLAAEMMAALRQNVDDFGVTYFDLSSGKQGIVHVVGPEQGITQPGTTIACGDSHTATHGAFGAIAFGIGTTQVRDVLATQTLALEALKVRRIEVNGDLRPGVYAKDVILHIIRRLGAKGGIGYAYEYAGDVFDRMSMEERMTVCNMSIEGGARCGYVNPDAKTVAYLCGRPYVDMSDFEATATRWLSFASDPDAPYDDVVRIDAADIEPTVTWGISPDHGITISETIPDPAAARTQGEKDSIVEALAYMKIPAGAPIKGGQNRRRLHWVVYQRADFRLPRGGQVHPRPPGCAGRHRAGRARFPNRRHPVRAGRLAANFPRRGLRVARCRLLDVPGHESRQAGGRPTLRLLIQPQFQGSPRLAHRPHGAHVAGHGGRRRDHWLHRRCP
jgi:3-isopropylmalate/(R)-2-methylmalate dehydratase large subunit